MSILIFIVILSILIFVHELGHFIVAKRLGVRVEQFSLGFGPQVLRYKRHGTEYLLCAIPLGGYVKMAGDNPEEFQGNPDEYLAQATVRRAGIVLAGPLLNYTLAFLCFWLVFFFGAPNLSCRVGELLDGFGAKQAGLEVGDKILAVDGKQVEIWQDLQAMIMKRVQGDVVRLSVLRENQRLQIPVRIKQKEIDTIFGEKKTIGLAGIRPADEFVTVRYGLVESFFIAGQRLFYLTGLTLKSLLWIASGQISVRDSLTGPLGIFFITRDAAHLGIIPLIQVVAMISMSLSIVNLLPIPVLDGGHLLFLLLEKIRRRRLSIQAERVFTQIGISIIVLLVIFVFYNDLLRYDVFGKLSQWWSR